MSAVWFAMLEEEMRERDMENKDLYFRCIVSHYLSGNSTLTSKVEFRLLKSISSKDIPYGPIEDFNQSGDFSSICFPDNPTNGAIYRADCIAGSRDFETGYLDDWCWEFVQVDEAEVWKEKRDKHEEQGTH